MQFKALIKLCKRPN